jgi:hypothetical protein
LLICNFIKVCVAKITAFEEFWAVRKILYYFLFFGRLAEGLFSTLARAIRCTFSASGVFGAASIPPLFGSISFGIFYCAIDYAIDKLYTLRNFFINCYKAIFAKAIRKCFGNKL